jgi:tetratricopeptide (TPR) repeat protein
VIESPWLRAGLMSIGCLLLTRVAVAERQPPGASGAKPVASGHSTSDSAHVVNLGDEAVLSRNISLYESGRYDECVSALRATLSVNAQKKTLRPEQVEQAQTYLAACLIANGKPEQADRVFADAIRINPQLPAPNGLIFPESVVNRFLRVREGLLSTIREAEDQKVRDAARRVKQQDEQKKRDAEVLRKLRALAEQETVVEKNHRWIASVPFGVGQFQNRDNAAGWIFFGVEAALLGTAVTAIAIDQRLANKAHVSGVNVQELSSKRQDAYRVLVASSWGFGLAAAAGIIHAHLRFVPERRSVRPRVLSRPLASAPIHSLDVGLNDSGGGLGLQLQVSF